jgi:hypothetical protein
MPGPGEFFIGTSAPITTRIGIRAAQAHAITVKGARDDIAASTAAQPIADVNFATKLGLLDKCIGIQWSGARFMYAGGNTTLNSFHFQFDPDGPVFDFPWNSFTCTGGFSKDGMNWDGNAPFVAGESAVAGAGSDGGTVFLCGIAGQQQLFAGGFNLVAAKDQGSGEPPILFVHANPIVATSNDGINWSVIPLGDFGNGDEDNQIEAVSYDPNSGTFTGYVVLNHEIGSSQYVGSISVTETDFKPNTNPDATAKPLMVVSTNLTTGSPQGSYAACCLPGQVMTFQAGQGTLEIGPHFNSILVNGSSTSMPKPHVNSVTINQSGSTLLGQFYDDNAGADGGEDNPIPEPFVYVSTDLGQTWTPTFPLATQDNEDSSPAHISGNVACIG